MTHAALGLRAHSGWAALVAVAGTRGAPAVIDRRRIELADPTIASILVAAVFACLALLRWMRPQYQPVEEEARHVGLLF